MSRLVPGLCSVTLRAASIDDVARAAGQCGLRAIEWGADVHVPPGDLTAATRARQASLAAGATAGSYGSYLFATGIPNETERAAVLDSAVELGAPNVRVWAGFGVERESGSYTATVDALRAFCAAAAERSMTVGLEYHGGTPTATVDGTSSLAGAVGAPNLFTYWQPPYWRDDVGEDSNAAEVTALADRLSHLHVYEWASAGDRRPLAEGAQRWQSVLRAAKDAVGAWRSDRYAFLEFVRGDALEALRRDAATLRHWLDALDASG